jgi:hypothetical protein
MRKALRLSLLAAAMICCQIMAAAQESKPLTNADVVAMVKAGLPETTVILAIQKGPTNFDTSPQALILLKNQGVGPKVMDAMLQPAGVAPATAPQSTAAPMRPNPFDPSSLTAGGGAAVPWGDVFLVDGDRRVQMKYSTSNARTNSMMGAMVNPFHKTKVRAALNGNNAQLRITNTSPLFEVTLVSNVNPTDVIALVRLTPKSDRREIETGRGGITGVSSGFRKSDLIPISVEDAQGAGGTNFKVYRAKVVSPLQPGEYALVTQAGGYYDFGVDASK